MITSSAFYSFSAADTQRLGTLLYESGYSHLYMDFSLKMAFHGLHVLSSPSDNSSTSSSSLPPPRSPSTSMILVDVGADTVNIIPFYKGIMLSNDRLQFDLGGYDITKYIEKKLEEKGALIEPFHIPSKRGPLFQFCEGLKKSYCFVAKDLQDEMARADSCPIPFAFVSPTSDDHKRQDGHLGEERFMGPEGLFQPSLIGTNTCVVPVIPCLPIRNIFSYRSR